jgi:hypothetical protein
VFRFGYERFELRARLGPGNLEHAIAEAAEVAARFRQSAARRVFGFDPGDREAIRDLE